MGKVRWAAYRPEDINYTARAMAEAWSREPERVCVTDPGVQRIRVSNVSGVLFVLGMGALALATWCAL
jgi:hypothetical protein